MKIKSLLLLVSSHFIFFAVPAGATNPNISFPSGFTNLSWLAADEHRVSDVKWKSQDVSAFLTSVDPENESWIPEDGKMDYPQIGDFKFIDLDSDGTTELIATLDHSGRRFFNTIVVISRQFDSFKFQKVSVWEMEKLTGIIQDLDNDGKMELFVRTSLTPYRGAQPMACWTAIYSMNTQGVYLEKSASFATYYEKMILPTLENDITLLETPSNKGLAGRSHETQGDHDVRVVERDKVLRVIGRDPKAGLSTAKAWSKDPDTTKRVFAATVLADIGGSEADVILDQLIKDKDIDVSNKAKAARSHM
jgi:hypothetical protein